MKTYKNFLAMLFTALFVCCCLSCDDSSGSDYNVSSSSDSSFNGETWYLCDFSNSYELKTNFTPVSWGEYLKFTDNTLYWNSRLGGENTTYSYTSSGETFFLYRNSYKEYEVSVISKQSTLLILKFNDGLYRWYTKKGVSSFSGGNNTSSLKTLEINVLIDGESFTGDYTIENGLERTLSFSCSDSENTKAENLPYVNARWDIASGFDCLSLNSNEGNEIKITNTNYSDSEQTVYIRLIVEHSDEKYTKPTVMIKLKVSNLPKKEISAKILYDGEDVSEIPVLASAQDVVLSCLLDTSDGKGIAGRLEWKIESGAGNALMSLDSNGNGINIFNSNHSGETKEIKIKVTVIPNDSSYNPTVASITFRAEDSTQDLQPGAFSASVSLNERTWGYDGKIKITWTKSNNAGYYYIFRNGKQIASLSNTETSYLDEDYGSDISYKNSNLRYCVVASNYGLKSTTDYVSISVEPLAPTVAPTNFYSFVQRDSEGFYGIRLTWDSTDYGDFDIYRLISNSRSVTADEIISRGKVSTYFGSSDEGYKWNNREKKFEFTVWDYDFLDEISNSAYIVHYVVLARNSWGKNAVTYSAPSNTYYDICGYIIGERCKWSVLAEQEEWTYRRTSSSSGGSSATSSNTTVKVEVHCVPCHGSGKCAKCNGKGKYYSDGHYGPKASQLDRYVKCDRCHGGGKCSYCNGTGRK
ncbi:MAG: zinc finger-like domain-containing protein [Treponema sp.]|nr:zinc finger-like domain-containing protein [Treponema sp.]